MTAAQLGAMPLILYEGGGNTRTITDAWFQRAGVEPQPIMEMGSAEAIKHLVGAGLGATVLTSLALRDPVPGAVTRKLRPAASRDLGIVAAGQLALHYWIAAFGTLASYAKQLGMEQAARDLHQCVEEAKAADEQHTALAEKLLSQPA